MICTYICIYTDLHTVFYAHHSQEKSATFINRYAYIYKHTYKNILIENDFE